MDIGNFLTDSALENNGVWRNCGDGRILVASTSSESYKKVFRRLLIPHETSINLGVADEKVLHGLETEAIAEALLLNWEGFTENGVELPYSRENAQRILKSVPRFREHVIREASSIENFRRKKEEVEIKNSAPASAGS